jgi:hypothetical protein
VASAVNSEGFRKILGICEGAKDDKSGWSAFLRHPVDRGLNGVQLIISDCCRGLIESAAEYLPDAQWQRCNGSFLSERLQPCAGNPGPRDHGRLWTYVRDGRPFGGLDPPAVAFRFYVASRKPGPIIEVACWAHARRNFFKLARLDKGPAGLSAPRVRSRTPRLAGKGRKNGL